MCLYGKAPKCVVWAFRLWFIFDCVAGWLARWLWVPASLRTHNNQSTFMPFLFTLWPYMCVCVSEFSAVLWMMWHRTGKSVFAPIRMYTNIVHLRFIRLFLFRLVVCSAMLCLCYKRQIYAHSDRIWGIQQQFIHSIYLQSRFVPPTYQLLYHSTFSEFMWNVIFFFIFRRLHSVQFTFGPALFIHFMNRVSVAFLPPNPPIENTKPKIKC